MRSGRAAAIAKAVQRLKAPLPKELHAALGASNGVILADGTRASYGYDDVLVVDAAGDRFEIGDIAGEDRGPMPARRQGDEAVILELAPRVDVEPTFVADGPNETAGLDPVIRGRRPDDRRRSNQTVQSPFDRRPAIQLRDDHRALTQDVSSCDILQRRNELAPQMTDDGIRFLAFEQLTGR